MSLPEVTLWQVLRTSPNGHRFRRQHPAGHYVLDFFCARASLAIEIDGLRMTGERPVRDEKRDTWLAAQRIDTLRIPAAEVLRDVGAVIEGIVAMVEERLVRFGKPAPPSALCAATSPSQVDGEDML